MDQFLLHDLEAQCIQECIPPCAAACPLHVDVRGLCAEINNDNFTGALQVFKKAIPFPGIVSRVCDQPCRVVCLRKKAIAIADLERACADFADTPDEKPVTVVKRKQRVAIVGGGLCGLTAAFDLIKKRYNVVVFDAASVLGGRVRSLPETEIPHSIIDSEIEALIKMGVEARLNSPISGIFDSNHTSLGQLKQDFDAVYVAFDYTSSYGSSLGMDQAGLSEVDAFTHTTTQNGIFANLAVHSPDSFILAMADGRSAAISIDRFIQRVSLTASRFNEGPFESCLYTNVDGIGQTEVTKKSGKAYSKKEAALEAGRCLQCECMECVKQCEYMKAYGEYPKKYVRSIYNNLSIVMGTRLANKLINSCSLCGQCAELCPNHLNLGEVCKAARQTMVTQGHMPPSAQDFALRDMEFSNSDEFVLSRHKPGTDSSTYLFFPGCQLSASAPEQVEKIYAYLNQHLSKVGLMLRCCGAPADWAGRQDLFATALEQIKSRRQEMGNPRVILACSSCYQIFKKNLPDVEIVSLWEIIEKYGLPEGTNTKRSGTLSIHDPCSIRQESQIHEAVRQLVRKTGYRIEELLMNREKTTCCSYGGEQWLANREVAEKVIDRRIAESANDYLTYCAMCRDFFASRGKATLHLLDLFFEDDLSARANRPNPGFSQRHENRAHLKRKLLRELWSETMPGQKSFETIKLVISDDVQKLLDDRLILVEDIQQVIENAERNDQKLTQPQSGHFLAHFKPTHVTYWVEYSCQGDTFVIYNAYSHRMELGEDLKK